MPPRKKKLQRMNTEQLEEEFEKYKSTDEYIIWRDFGDQRKQYIEVNTGTRDLTDTFQPFFDKLAELMKIFKVKVKKELKHEYFRGIFFGGGASGDSQNIPITIDNVLYYIVKIDNDAAYRARQNFLAVYNQCDEFPDLDGKKYQESRKKMQKNLKDFATAFDTYVKNHHEKIHEILNTALLKLRHALEANFQYSMYDYTHQKEDERTVNDFKEKAYLDKLCDELQKVWEVLLDTQYIKDNPSLHVLTAKFKIEGWRKNKIQSFFLEPLYQTWGRLRKEMIRLYVFGEDHWVLGYGENKEMMDHTKELINLELIAERMLGNALKRDQLNFMFNTILYVFNSPGKEKLLKDDKGILEYTIPNLLVLRYLDHIVKITQVKRREAEKDARKKEILESVYGAKNEEKKEGETQTQEDGTVEEIKAPERDTKMPQITAMEKEDTEEDMRQYGRYWIWYDYFPEGFDKEIIAAAEELRKINMAVRQDMADYFIARTLKTKAIAGRGLHNVDNLKKKKEEISVEDEKIRPPKLWNHPDIVEKPHNYRSNANPHQCYEDKRIQDMEARIEFLAREIQNYTPIRWKELVERVILYFKDFPEEKHNPIPTPLDQYEVTYP